MKKSSVILLSLFFVSIISCSLDKKEITGDYKLTGHNLIDSLIILDNGAYIHKLYSNNKILLYQSSGIWNYKNDRIELFSFFDNQDNELNEILSEKDAEKFNIRCSCPVYKKNNATVIDINADEGLYYIK